MRNLLVVCISVLFLSCNSTQNTVKYAENSKALTEWVENKTIKVVLNSASPLAANEFASLRLLPQGSSANRILLNGNDFFTMKGDHVNVDFPYYGTQQQSTAFSFSESGVKFEGIPDSYKVDYNEKKKIYTMQMDLTNGNETFEMTVKLFPSLKAIVYINTNRRTSITYQGVAKELEASTE